jgi:hypothetical protein
MSAIELTNMTGISLVLSSPFKRVQTSKPSMPGIRISNRIKSGGDSCTRFRAASPLRAVCTLYPFNFKISLNISRLSSVSSTMRILADEVSKRFPNLRF